MINSICFNYSSFIYNYDIKIILFRNENKRKKNVYSTRICMYKSILNFFGKYVYS